MLQKLILELLGVPPASPRRVLPTKNGNLRAFAVSNPSQQSTSGVGLSRLCQATQRPSTTTGSNVNTAFRYFFNENYALVLRKKV